jgi:hypothetical protein
MCRYLFDLEAHQLRVLVRGWHNAGHMHKHSCMALIERQLCNGRTATTDAPMQLLSGQQAAV